MAPTVRSSSGQRTVVVAPACTVRTWAVAGWGVLAGPVAVLQRPADWAIAMCDVGQGDAVLVRSAGRTLLIDTGPDPDPLRGCLAGLGIERLDVLVLTHFDHDHAGASDVLVGRAAGTRLAALFAHGVDDVLGHQSVGGQLAAGQRYVGRLCVAALLRGGISRPFW